LNGFEFAHWHAQLSFAKKEEREKYLRSNAPVVLGTMRIEGEAEMAQKEATKRGELFLGVKLHCATTTY